jgi:hypothetical protein
MKLCMPLFDDVKNNPKGLWQAVVQAQARDKAIEKQQKEEQEKEQRQRVAAVRHRLRPGELWRATDFWRQGLLQEVRNDIKKYNQRQLDQGATNYTKIKKAKDEQNLPTEFFVKVKDWLWSVKEDGYLVKLIRDENNKWSMRTRKDTLLCPPPAFLQGLETNEELPSLMVGELVTDFTGCAEHLRRYTGNRNKE